MVAEIPEDKVTRTVAAIDMALEVTGGNCTSKGSQSNSNHRVRKQVGGLGRPERCKVRETGGKVRKNGSKKKGSDSRWVPVGEVQVLLGLLGFCGQILVSGMWKLPWSVLALRLAITKGYAPMNGFWEAELGWWRSLLTDWNRKALLVAPQWLVPMKANELSPFTDASRSKKRLKGGAGAVFGNIAMAFQFEEEELEWLDIADLEGLVSVLWIVMICEHCPDKIQGMRFEAWCDNMTWVTSVNEHKSSVPTMACLLDVVHEYQARCSFDLRMIFVKSEDNVAADAASREEWGRFFSFMQSVGYDDCDIDWLDVNSQVELRSSIVSELKSMRRLASDMSREQSTVGEAR